MATHVLSDPDMRFSSHYELITILSEVICRTHGAILNNHLSLSDALPGSHPTRMEETMSEQTRLLILGRQGSGKGTQSIQLAETLGITHVSTGDLFRSEVARKSALGMKVGEYLDKGALVPDDLVVDVVMNQTADLAGWVLDGFPRTMSQGRALFGALGDNAIDLAIELDVPVHQVINRLSTRRVCDGCGANSTAPSDDNDIRLCNACGGSIVRRSDDTVEAIESRLINYDKLTGPLLIWLDSLGLLATVDGTGLTNEVFQQLLVVIADRLLLNIEAVDAPF